MPYSRAGWMERRSFERSAPSCTFQRLYEKPLLNTKRIDPDIS
jgi:hypothetical protein